MSSAKRKVTAPVRSLNVIERDLRGAYQREQKAHKAQTVEFVHIGALLCEAELQVEHGQWLRWLKDKWSESDRTARRRMRVYKFLDQQGHIGPWPI